MAGTGASGDAALRLALCDDALAYPMMVQGWFAGVEDFDLVALLRTRAELLAGVAELRLDALLLDVVLPDGETDAAFVDEVRAAAGRPLRVVLVSSFAPLDLIPIAKAAGADGCASKAGGVEGLLRALRP